MTNLTNSMRPTLWASAALLALSACGTQEISAPGVIVGDASDLKQGALWAAFAPTARTYEAHQAATANLTQYQLFVDGAMLVQKVDGAPNPFRPMIVLEGGWSDVGAVPAGKHHFSVAAEGGGPTIAAGDGEIEAGSETGMYIYGDLDALHIRLVSFPRVPAEGTLHVSLVNLVRSGTRIQAVSCADATHCTPVSAPLALGESFEDDFPGGEIEGQVDRRAMLAGGGFIGFRQLPTTALPAPQVSEITQAFNAVFVGPVPSTPPRNFSAAPVYFSAQGEALKKL